MKYKDGQKDEIHSFPTMYMTGVHWVEMGQNNDLLQKSSLKTFFLRDTNLDQPTLGGSGTQISTRVLKNIEHQLRNELLWARMWNLLGVPVFELLLLKFGRL